MALTQHVSLLYVMIKTAGRTYRQGGSICQEGGMPIFSWVPKPIHSPHGGVNSTIVMALGRGTAAVSWVGTSIPLASTAQTCTSLLTETAM